MAANGMTRACSLATRTVTGGGSFPEFATVSVRRSRLRRMAEDGNALAARLLPVVDDPHALEPLYLHGDGGGQRALLP